MTHFERTEGAEDNLGKNPEFKNLDEIAVDGNPIPSEEVEEVSEGTMLGNHSEDGLEPDSEWENNLENEELKTDENPEISEDKFADLADDIQKYHDKEIEEDEAKRLHEQDLASLRDRLDRGNKDYDRETIRGEDAA